MCIVPLVYELYPSYVNNPILADGFKKRPTTKRIPLLIGDRDLCEGWPSVKILQIIILCLCACPNLGGRRNLGWECCCVCVIAVHVIFIFEHNSQYCKKRLAVFLSPAGMSLTKLSLD